MPEPTPYSRASGNDVIPVMRGQTRWIIAVYSAAAPADIAAALQDAQQLSTLVHATVEARTWRRDGGWGQEVYIISPEQEARRHVDMDPIDVELDQWLNRE